MCYRKNSYWRIYSKNPIAFVMPLNHFTTVKMRRRQLLRSTFSTLASAVSQAGHRLFSSQHPVNESALDLFLEFEMAVNALALQA